MNLNNYTIKSQEAIQQALQLASLSLDSWLSLPVR